MNASAGKRNGLPGEQKPVDSIPVDDIDFRSSEDRSVQELLEEHQRKGVRPFSAEVEEFERLDEDRRSDILNSIDKAVHLEKDEWMDPDYENADIEVDWEKLREDTYVDSRNLDKLEEKYGSPAGLFKLSVNPGDEVEWQPADFFSLKLPETPDINLENSQIPEIRRETAEDETVFRAYSIGNSPNSEQVEFYIKRIPNEESTEQSLTPVLEAKMEKTDEVMLRGPYNDELSLNETSDSDLVYVSTGTGMAPLKSMLEFTIEENLDDFEGEDREIYIFSGASYEDELPGDEEFRKLAEENENVNYIPTVSREDLITDWNGETDYVQNLLRKYDGEINFENAEVYVCGMSGMAQEVRETVDELGLDTSNGKYQEEVFD
ncbi:MAG: hypothetical protein ABEK04_01785 [Candidatus Nanohalobium sp.]